MVIPKDFRQGISALSPEVMKKTQKFFWYNQYEADYEKLYVEAQASKLDMKQRVRTILADPNSSIMTQEERDLLIQIFSSSQTQRQSIRSTSVKQVIPNLRDDKLRHQQSKHIHKLMLYLKQKNDLYQQNEKLISKLSNKPDDELGSIRDELDMCYAIKQQLAKTHESIRNNLSEKVDKLNQACNFQNILIAYLTWIKQMNFQH